MSAAAQCIVLLSGLLGTTPPPALDRYIHEALASIQPPLRLQPVPELIVALIATESAFKPEARSRANAKGLMQLTPIAVEEARRQGCDVRGELEVPRVNVRIGVCFFKYLLTYYGGNATLALAHYNGGGRAVAPLRKMSATNKETANYITKIMYGKEHCRLNHKENEEK